MEKMKTKSLKIILFFALLISSIVIFAEPKEAPEWVQRYKQGQAIKDYTNYYFGIGVSEKSKKDAGNEALQEFGRNIETKVRSEIKNQLQEKSGKVSEFTSTSVEISSDIGLKGIAITNRFEEDGIYYSLIRYEREEFNRILKEEIQRDIERKWMEFEKKKEESKLKEEKQKEQIRKDKEKAKIKKSKDKVKKQLMDYLKKKHAEFFSSPPPFNVISFQNGELIPKKMEIGAKAGIAPFTFEAINFSYKYWLLQFTARSNFYESKYISQDLLLKYQIFPNAGEFYKISVSFGAVGYFYGLLNNNFFEAEQKYSPFLSGNITLPNLHFTYASFYGDATKAAVGVNNYFLYSQLKDRLSAIIELNYIFDKDFQNEDKDDFVFQAGLRFKTTENVITTLSFEDHELIVFSIDVEF